MAELMALRNMHLTRKPESLLRAEARDEATSPAGSIPQLNLEEQHEELAFNADADDDVNTFDPAIEAMDPFASEPERVQSTLEDDMPEDDMLAELDNDMGASGSENGVNDEETDRQLLELEADMAHFSEDLDEADEADETEETDAYGTGNDGYDFGDEADFASEGFAGGAPRLPSESDTELGNDDEMTMETVPVTPGQASLPPTGHQTVGC